MVSARSFYLSLKTGTKVLLSGHRAPLFFTVPHDSRWAFPGPSFPPGDFSRLEGLTASSGALLSPPTHHASVCSYLSVLSLPRLEICLRGREGRSIRVETLCSFSPISTMPSAAGSPTSSLLALNLQGKVMEVWRKTLLVYVSLNNSLFKMPIEPLWG